MKYHPKDKCDKCKHIKYCATCHNDLAQEMLKAKEKDCIENLYCVQCKKCPELRG